MAQLPSQFPALLYPLRAWVMVHEMTAVTSLDSQLGPILRALELPEDESQEDRRSRLRAAVGLSPV